MHPNEPYHNIFLGRACPEPPSNKMAQRYAQHNASGMYYNPGNNRSTWRYGHYAETFRHMPMPICLHI